MSRLLENSENFRIQNITRNIYDKEDTYNIGNSRALSDGDEFGKGLTAQGVGSATDIRKREELAAKSLYNKENPYNINNA